MSSDSKWLSWLFWTTKPNLFFYVHLIRMYNIFINSLSNWIIDLTIFLDCMYSCFIHFTWWSPWSQIVCLSYLHNVLPFIWWYWYVYILRLCVIMVICMCANGSYHLLFRMSVFFSEFHLIFYWLCENMWILGCVYFLAVSIWNLICHLTIWCCVCSLYVFLSLLQHWTDHVTLTQVSESMVQIHPTIHCFSLLGDSNHIDD